jgi:hypothetical protein
MSPTPDTDRPFSIDEHPTSLLAPYVDGAATDAERAEVERHLEACATCRSEIQTARLAAQALRSSPLLEGPVLDAAALREAAIRAEEEDRRPVISIRERRRDRRPMVATALGLAAAAAVAGAVVFALGRGGGSGSGSTAAGGSAVRAAPAGHQLTQQDLRQLTDTLVQAQRAASGQQTLAGDGGAAATSPASEGGASEPATSSPAQFAGASPVTIDPTAAAGVPCARRASGQDVSAQVVYAQRGVFAGKRVDVIGFVSPPAGGGPAHVTVVAVPVGECSVAFLAREAVG